MKFINLIKTMALALVLYVPTSWAANPVDLNIKYSSNYLMPAYVHFKADGRTYSVVAKINIPLYNIVFTSSGWQDPQKFSMLNYKDVRNGKPYAVANIDNKNIEYGKIKDGLEKVALDLPTFDLFTMAFQLSYFDQLPPSFQITNGKKLYPMPNVKVQRSEKKLTNNGQQVTEITYKFRTGTKDIMVKKFAGEQFPRYIQYVRDGDNYELEFSEIVK